MTRHRFAFAGRYRVAALPFAVTPRTAWVDLDEHGLRVRFGPWRLRTPIANVAGVERSGGFGFLRTAGPPHLSFADRGITFATNGEAAVCVRFHDPVAGIDPVGVLRHPGATLTVEEPDRLLHEVERLRGA